MILREGDRRFRVYEEAPGFRPGPRADADTDFVSFFTTGVRILQWHILSPARRIRPRHLCYPSGAWRHVATCPPCHPPYSCHVTPYPPRHPPYSCHITTCPPRHSPHACHIITCPPRHPPHTCHVAFDLDISVIHQVRVSRSSPGSSPLSSLLSPLSSLLSHLSSLISPLSSLIPSLSFFMSPSSCSSLKSPLSSFLPPLLPFAAQILYRIVDLIFIVDVIMNFNTG